MSKFQFEALDLNEIEGEAKRSAATGQKQRNDKYFNLDKDGYAILRFLPRIKGTRFFQETRLHALGHGDKKRTYHCARVLTKKPDGKIVWMPANDGPDCVFCKYYNHLWQKGERLQGKAQEDMKNASRKLKPYERYYYNVVAREYTDPMTKKVEKNFGPLIFSCGKELHAKIMTAMVGDLTSGLKKLGDISHPVTGRDFRYVKKTVTGSGGVQYPSYDNSSFEDVCPAGTDEELEAWMGNLHNLTGLREVKDEATMTKALKVHLGLIAGEDDDEFNYAQFEGGAAGNDEEGSEYSVGELMKKAETVSVRVDAEPPTTKKPIVKQEKVEKPTPASAAAKGGSALDLAADPEFMAELDALDD